MYIVTGKKNVDCRSKKKKGDCRPKKKDVDCRLKKKNLDCRPKKKNVRISIERTCCSVSAAIIHFSFFKF